MNPREMKVITLEMMNTSPRSSRSQRYAFLDVHAHCSILPPFKPPKYSDIGTVNIPPRITSRLFARGGCATKNQVAQAAIALSTLLMDHILFLDIVFGSLVQSGFLMPQGLNRNHNWSSQFEKCQKTRLNRNRPVFCSLLQLQNQF